MAEPNWIIVTLVGAFLGWLVPALWRLGLFALQAKRFSIVQGQWHVYHSTIFEDKVLIQYGCWTIRRSFTAKYKVEERRPPNKQVLYAGTLSLEDNSLLVELEGQPVGGKISIRLQQPIRVTNLIVWGVFIAKDFDHNPIAGWLVMSKQELTEIDLQNLLSQRVKLHSKFKLISI